MRSAIYTVYEGNYHLGVAALVNSAVRSGFRGDFFVGFGDVLPPWVRGLQSVSESEYRVEGVNIKFERVSSQNHLRYLKANFGRALLQQNPEIDALFYCDPDILFLAPWQFFEDWVEGGVALVGDSNFSQIPAGHPWQKLWRQLTLEAGLQLQAPRNASYINSGFVGLRREHVKLIEIWSKLVTAAGTTGIDLRTFDRKQRWKGVVGDQDLLNAACMIWDGPTVILGPEAMGFTHYHFLLAHAIESPKPWAKSFFWESLKGNPPTGAAALWTAYTAAPIAALTKPKQAIVKLDILLGKFISRFWRRTR